jgi:DNA-directed RNA polymerase subunit E"
MKKVCKNCKLIVKGKVCPACKGNQFVDHWKGLLVILDPENSKIAKKLDIKVKGEYAIKV